MGQHGSKWVQTGQNRATFVKGGLNRSKKLTKDKSVQAGQNGSKLVKNRS